MARLVSFLLFLYIKKRDHNADTTFLLDVLLKIYIFSLSLFCIDKIIRLTNWLKPEVSGPKLQIGDPSSQLKCRYAKIMLTSFA